MNDRDLISRSALMKRLELVGMDKSTDFRAGVQFGVERAIDVVKEAPSVDAVAVVRCCECKYHNKAPCPMRLSLNWTEDNDFCSYGERKGDDA